MVLLAISAVGVTDGRVTSIHSPKKEEVGCEGTNFVTQNRDEVVGGVCFDGPNCPSPPHPLCAPSRQIMSVSASLTQEYIHIDDTASRGPCIAALLLKAPQELSQADTYQTLT